MTTSQRVLLQSSSTIQVISPIEPVSVPNGQSCRALAWVLGQGITISQEGRHVDVGNKASGCGMGHRLV